MLSASNRPGFLILKKMKASASVQSIAIISINNQNRITLIERVLPVKMTRKHLFAHHGETSVWKNCRCFFQRVINDKN